MPLNQTEFVDALKRTQRYSGVQLLVTGTVLPEPGSELNWQIFGLLKVPGTSPDIFYICLADNASSSGYSWVELASGNGGASGTDSIASGTTTKAVTHGLSYTPTIDQIIITFAEQGTNDYGRWWVDTIGATTFTVNVSADPGASNLDFGWRVI